MNDKHVAVITINWNNYASTKQCLLSLQSADSEDVEVIVIDNGSVDDSGKALEREFPDVTFIFNGKNLGFAAGVNAGIKRALNGGVKFVFLLNNDAEVEKNTIDKLVNVLESDRHNGVAGPRIFYAHNRNKVWQGGGIFKRIKMGVFSFEKNKIIDRNSKDDKPQQVDFLSGCALLIKRDVFERIGLVDERFFFYGEDLDFCYNAKRAGFNVVYVPEVAALHDIKEIEKTRTNPFVLYHLARSYFLFIKKNFSFKWLLYGVFLFVFTYTPFRMYQIIKGGNKISSISSWLEGGVDGLVSKRP